MEYLDLLLLNGEIVRIKCPPEHIDECYETLEYAMKRKDRWSPSRFNGCTAEYLGILMGSINMGQVMGML